MKVLYSKSFRYVDQIDGMYLFESLHPNKQDREFVLVKQAKMIFPDGSYQYYNIVDADNYGAVDRLIQYNRMVKNISASVDETAKRVCLTQRVEPTHIPKRSVAVNEVAVSPIKKVNHRKRFVGEL